MQNGGSRLSPVKPDQLLFEKVCSMNRKSIPSTPSKSSGTARRESRSRQIQRTIDALRARLTTLSEDDSDEAMLNTNQLIMLGVDILLSLAKSERLYHPGGNLDLAEESLCVQAQRLASELCALSQNCRGQTIAAVW